MKSWLKTIISSNKTIKDVINVLENSGQGIALVVAASLNQATAFAVPPFTVASTEVKSKVALPVPSSHKLSFDHSSIKFKIYLRIISHDYSPSFYNLCRNV